MQVWTFIDHELYPFRDYVARCALREWPTRLLIAFIWLLVFILLLIIDCFSLIYVLLFEWFICGIITFTLIISFNSIILFIFSFVTFYLFIFNKNIFICLFSCLVVHSFVLFRLVECSFIKFIICDFSSSFLIDYSTLIFNLLSIKSFVVVFSFKVQYYANIFVFMLTLELMS